MIRRQGINRTTRILSIVSRFRLRHLFTRCQVNLVILFYLIGMVREKKAEQAERQENAGK